MTDPLARSKEILAEAHALIDEHDRKYHPEYFDKLGNRKQVKESVA